MDDNVQKKEMLSYLFINIKWNQEPGTEDLEHREPFQIGVIAADRNMQKIKIFSRGIRLSNIKSANPVNLRLCHTTETNVMMGKSKEEVYHIFDQTFPEYRYIIVWNRDTYNLWKRDMIQCKIRIRKHKAIFLQEVLGSTADNEVRKIGFKSALEYSKIEYDSAYLNNAKHDVNYLYQLYCTCYKQYRFLTADDYCIANTITYKLHACGCRYTKALKIENTVLESQSAVFLGYTACRVCKHMLIWNQLKWDQKIIKTARSQREERLRNLLLSEDAIEEICRYFGFSYNISNEMVFIKTAISSWIVYFREGKVYKLYHESFTVSRSLYMKMQKKKCLEGYHQQKLISKNFFDVASYIKYHDAGATKRMVKKNRMEQLFAKIHSD